MTNKNFIFQTGHAKGLARIEIESILGDVIKKEVKDGFVVEADIEDPVDFLSRMGSTVRITEIIQSGPSRMPLNFEEWVVSAITEAKKHHEGKFRYGFSMHPKSEKVLKNVLIGSKKKLKVTGNVRFVNKDFQNLSSVQAWHQKLLKANAIELHLFQGDDRWYLSKTLAIQNFEWYSERDYDRPSKSAKNGMFPPKLAQILINTAEQKEGSTIYDPFCGSGTVLQEALLMGFKAAGSDLSEEMIKDSEENLEWLANKREVAEYNVFEADATTLSAEQLPNGPFAIVTETWLGPMLEKELTELERPKVQREVEALYDAFFSNLKKIVKEPTIVVFTAPYHRDQNERYFLPRLPEILAENGTVLKLSEHERPSMFFERKSQFVSREIWKVQIDPVQ